jgi:serine/threonine protein kinase
MPICPKCHGENPELGAKCPRDGHYYIYDDAIADAEKDEWIGKLAADKYVILSLISEGGMGAVYRAMQLPVQREVAFKVLRAELQDSDQGQDRFAREARAVSKLTHPNIITMHDFGVDDDGHPFMVMEYAPGKSLADWMMQPGLKLDRISHVFRQILSALSEAHQQGIIHRDLKPENLIVTKTGSDSDYIKLLDFGIARMVHDGATRGLTREGEVFGTPHYMAPEQAQGKKDIGPPADVYALGIMFYEMLSGDCPFDAPTPLSILYMHINDDLPELTPRNGISLPDPMRQVVLKATAKAPEDRYQSAGEMLAAFDAAVGNTSGLFAAPAGVSSENIQHTQNMGAQQHIRRATADTLHLDGGQKQRITGTSNGVQVHDPHSGGTMTAELEALKSSNGTKWLVAGAVLAVLLGVGAALLFTGDSGTDSPTPDTEQAAAGANEGNEASAESEANAPADGEAVEQAENNAADDEPSDDEPSDEQVAVQDKAAQDAPIADPAAAALAKDDGEPTATRPPATTGDKKADDAKPETASAPSTTKPKSPTRTPDTTDESSDKEIRPTTTKPTTVAKDEPKDEPKKFQPKKFRPKAPAEDDSDDEPKKFQPRKWR